MAPEEQEKGFASLTSPVDPGRVKRHTEGRAKHTPGPWRLFLTRDGRKLIGIGDKDGGGVADCGFGTWRDGEEQLANARLIAAAPELLESLREVKELLRFALLSTTPAIAADAMAFIRKADLAIAKATGAQS